MDAKLSKLRLFVDSLEREEINEEEQALMLMGGLCIFISIMVVLS